MNKKIWISIIVVAISTLIALPPYLRLLEDPLSSERYGHIPLIPVVSLFLALRKRREIFRGTASFSAMGLTMIVLSAGILVVKKSFAPEKDVYASICTLAALLILWGSYLLLFGKGCGRKAFFPLAFLAFAIPVPAFLMEKIIIVLTSGSVVMTRLIFDILKVPLLQDGPVFYLPGFFIKVAQECSGIRSSLALLITTVLACHIFLRGFWRQLLLISIVVPVALLKNAIRIVTLYILSYFIDIRIIEGGYLHKSGGVFFFGLGLAILGGVLWILRRGNVQK